MKQHAPEIYETMTLPTMEFLQSQWKQVSARWVLYPDWRACFADRLATLERLSNAYPYYAAALDATTPEDYIREVSHTKFLKPGTTPPAIEPHSEVSTLPRTEE